MTERTYGKYGETLFDIEQEWEPNTPIADMAEHIRDLLAENAKLASIAQHYEAAYLNSVEECDKLKAERREFGMLVAEEVTLKCIAAVISGKQMVTADLAAIVEQELAK